MTTSGYGLGDLLLAIVAAPALVTFLLGASWLLGIRISERVTARLTTGVLLFMTLASAWLGIAMMRQGLAAITRSGGAWIRVANYEFPLQFVADRLSMPLIILTCVLAGLVASFSTRYLHREKGYLRFFLLLNVFAFGMLLLLTAGSIDLLIAGWELVGITSVLLIAFFQERPGPVRSAAHVFAMYKVGDLGLLLGVFVIHTVAGTSQFARLMTGAWPHQAPAFAGSRATLACMLLLFAAAAKSAQIPFSGWLPRAMEGPTPSSAIFYGALSIHAGAYLMLRIVPLMTPFAQANVVVVGLLSALLGTLSQRVAPDAKTSIAYAAMTQLGIIFMEIGLGFPHLALTHVVGHTLVRTLQFLRAPSMLHDFHRVHAAAGGHLAATGEHYGTLPAGLRLWLYRLGLHRGFYDAGADRFLVAPLLGVSRFLNRLEPATPPPGGTTHAFTAANGPNEALAGRQKN